MQHRPGNKRWGIIRNLVLYSYQGDEDLNAALEVMLAKDSRTGT